jgi:hypothetical protein
MKGVGCISEAGTECTEEIVSQNTAEEKTITAAATGLTMLEKEPLDFTGGPEDRRSVSAQLRKRGHRSQSVHDNTIIDTDDAV